MKRLLFLASLVFVPLLHAQAPVPQPFVSVTISNVKFENTSRLSPARRRELAAEIKTNNRWPISSPQSLLSASIRQRVLAAYSDEGYWRARVEVTVVPVRSGEVEVAIRGIKEGRQYHLGGLAWSGVTAFPESQLSEVMGLRQGEVIKRTQAEQGMESVRRLYASRGYLNYSAVPQIQFNDERGTLILQLAIDEGGSFTFEKLDVLGADSTVRDRLLKEWPLLVGDVYPENTVEDFLAAHLPLLPPARQRDLVCRTLDLSTHTIAFVLDFRAQPLACVPSPDVDTTHQTLNRLTAEP